MALAASSDLTADPLTAKAGWLRAGYERRSSACAVAALPVGPVALPLQLLAGVRGRAVAQSRWSLDTASVRTSSFLQKVNRTRL